MDSHSYSLLAKLVIAMAVGIGWYYLFDWIAGGFDA